MTDGDISFRSITNTGHETILHQICFALEWKELLNFACVDRYYNSFVSLFNDPIYWKTHVCSFTNYN